MTTNIASNRKFGIELELITRGLSSTGLASYLSDNGIPCLSEGYNHETKPHWKIVPDSSLPMGGKELVSPILQGQEGIETVEKVCDILGKCGAKVSKNCGFHVHVDAHDLTAKHILNVVERYIKFEQQIDLFMPKSRRGNVNRFCRQVGRSNLADALYYAADEGYLAEVIAENSRERFNNHELFTSCRYYKINLASLCRHGTIEFRQHSGTVKFNKVHSWINFCLAFVEASSQTPEDDGWQRGIPPEVVEFYNKRVNKLNERYKYRE